jgi:ADP-ribose pyrophosphatase YjhB (NUDIX family)
MKLKRVFLTLCSALLIHSTATAEAPAGMVLYFKSGGEVYLLLAEHAGSQRGWAAFGGGDREGESLVQTAAHKTHEETRGYFSRATLEEQIKNQQPLMDGSYATYFAEVDFVPAQRVMNAPIPADDDAFGERSTFAWIPYSTIADYLTNDITRDKKYPIDPAFLPAGSETNWLWTAWLTNMRKGLLEGSLPWLQK